MAVQLAVRRIFKTAKRGDALRVAKMLDEDPELLSSLWEDDTLLTWAVKNTRVSMVRLLLEKGAEVDGSNVDGLTALGLAAQKGHEEMVRILLSSGADPTRQNPMGVTVLMLACFSRSAAMVRLILQLLPPGERGLNKAAHYGRTAVWWACWSGHEEILKILLLAGASHTLPASFGQTPLKVAQEGHRDGCVAIIQWWEGELERAYVLHRARRLWEEQRELSPALKALPAVLAAHGPLPSYVAMRARPFPTLEVVCLAASDQSDAAAGKGTEEQDGGQGEERSEEEKDAVLKYVLDSLSTEVCIELLEGFHK